jgi:Fe-S-cluster containining protein
MSFPCTGCGVCCTLAGFVADFPEPTLDNGHCVHLDSANRCVVYSTRPDKCRIKPGTHRENALICNSLQRWFVPPQQRKYVSLALIRE